MRIDHLLQNGSHLEMKSVGDSIVQGVTDGYAFEIVLKGKLIVNFDHRQNLLYPDSFTIMAPGTHYQLESQSMEDTKLLTIVFPTAYISSLQANDQQSPIMPIQSMFPFRGDLRYTVLNLAKRLLQTRDCPEKLLEKYLEHLLVSYFRLYHDEIIKRLASLSFTKDETKRDVFSKLILAKEFLLNNYNKGFAIEELASYCYLSVNHLLRTFKQAYGISPYRYLTLIRLNRARLYLETGNYSINETVIMVGFESVSSFIKLFKATFNTTPLKYRKQSTALSDHD